MLDSETRRRIDTARDILVGKVPDPKTQVEQITFALIYKFMDDMDQQSVSLGGKATFFANGYEQYAWYKLMDRKLGGAARMDLYVRALEGMSTNPHIPQLFRDIFKGAFMPYRDPETLNLFLKEMNGFTYAHSEDLGDAYEYLLSIFASQGKAGQFRTPRHIIDFIVDCVGPNKHDTVLDPACGTAGFLICTYKQIIEQNKGTQLSGEEQGRLTANFVGYDISPDMVRLSRVNMYLHQFANPTIHEYDTLTYEDRWDETFDVILANPPFMTPKGGIRPHTRFAVQANRSEVLFVDYIAEHLNPSGRAGVIVPEGIIFQSANAYKALRKMLVDGNYLVAVISLPAGIFQPYSGVKTSVLLLDKDLAKRTDRVLFVSVKADGYDLGAQRREIERNDLPEALRMVKAFQQDPTAEPVNPLMAQAVSKQKLGSDGDYNLSGERYKATKVVDQKWPMVSIEELFCEIKNGFNVKQEDNIGKYRVTRIQTIADGSVNLAKTKWTNDEVKNSAFMEKGDILLSHINSIDHLAKTAIFNISGEKVVHGINLLRLRPNKKLINPDYAILCFKSKRFVDRALTFAQKAVNQASIKASDIRKIRIPLPPLEEQQAIVDEIEGYQKIIDGARQVVENYKPVIKIDPSWPLVKLGEVCEVQSGIGFPLKYQGLKDEQIPFLKVSDMNLPGNDIYITSWNNSISESTLGILNAKSAPEGTIIFPKIGAAIATNKKRILTRLSVFDNNVMGIIPSKKINQKFLYYLLKKFDLSNWASDSSLPSMRKTTVEAYLIPLPPIIDQNKAVIQLDREQELIDSNNKLIEIFSKKIEQVVDDTWGISIL